MLADDPELFRILSAFLSECKRAEDYNHPLIRGDVVGGLQHGSKSPGRLYAPALVEQIKGIALRAAMSAHEANDQFEMDPERTKRDYDRRKHLVKRYSEVTIKQTRR